MDAGATSARRHVIPVWFTADVTDVLDRLGRDAGVSVTSYVAATLAAAVARNPRAHAIRDVRGRIVTFDSVDINTTVEVRIDGAPLPLNHVLRNAAARSAHDLHAEIHRVKNDPETSDTLRLRGATRWYLMAPALIRRRVFLGSLHRLPDLQRRLIGTVGLTSVGMHTQGTAVGLPFLLHTMDVLVGGLEERAGVADDGSVTRRSHLGLSLVADHDVIDGVPLARFVADFRQALEAGSALDD